MGARRLDRPDHAGAWARDQRLGARPFGRRRRGSRAPQPARGRRPRRARLGGRRAIGRVGRSQARPPRSAPGPGGDGHRPRLGVHGARSAHVHPASLGRPATSARAVQQLELPAGVALARAAGPPHEPRERLDVPRADPPARARPRSGRRKRLRRTRDARRPGADHGATDRLRRVAGRSRRVTPAPHDEPLRAHPQGRGDLRDRRRRLEPLEGVPERLAEPQGAHGRERELPQRDRGLVPRGHRVRARHDRHRRVPEPPRRDRSQHPRRAGRRPQGLRLPRERPAGRHLDPHPLRPLARGDERLGRPDRLPGVAPRHDGVRRAQPARRRLAGRGVLGRGRHRDLAAAQPRAVPAPRIDADRRRLPALPRRVRRSGLGRPVHPRRAPVPVLPPADRAVSRRCDRGGVRRRADRGRRDQPALDDVQVAGLHGPRLRHGLEVDRSAAARRRRAARAPEGDARRPVPERVRTGRDRRPRAVPAPRLGGRCAARPDPARAVHRVTVLGRDRRGRRASCRRRSS